MKKRLMKKTLPVAFTAFFGSFYLLALIRCDWNLIVYILGTLIMVFGLIISFQNSEKFNSQKTTAKERLLTGKVVPDVFFGLTSCFYALSFTVSRYDALVVIVGGMLGIYGIVCSLSNENRIENEII
jgi:hypothetical protein